MSSRRCWKVATATLVAVAPMVLACSAPLGRSGRAGAVGETYFAPGQRRSAPALSGKTLAGPRLALTDARGRVVVINVWASWCLPCRRESRGLGRLSTTLARQGVRFIGIDEHDTDSRGRAFAATSGTNYPQLVDPHGEVLARLTLLPSMGIPSTVVIDRAGRMAARIIGPADETVLRSLIERVAADR